MSKPQLQYRKMLEKIKKKKRDIDILKILSYVQAHTEAQN